jgi:steroid delta-isomerase-like uncharacterized protein
MLFATQHLFIHIINKEEFMATDQNKNFVDRFFDEMCNRQKLNLADELFSANHIYHDPQTPTGPGPEGMKQVISTYQTAFPDAHWKVVHTIVSGDEIITRWQGTGTHKKELNGIPPTGKSVKVDGIWIHRFANNKISESWNVWDTLGLLQQLGVVPVVEQSEA